MTEQPIPRETARRLARRTLFAFILTFAASRIMVFLIMAGEVPNFYFFLHGTHVHHLNYGIFLLAGVCGYSVFRRPVGKAAERTAFAYGIAMGLTFDEFGMWLHLGGSYWQRASIDAVIVIAAALLFVSFARSVRRFELKHKWIFTLLGIALLGFATALYVVGNRLGAKMGPELETLESASSP